MNMNNQDMMPAIAIVCIIVVLCILCCISSSVVTVLFNIGGLNNNSSNNNNNNITNPPTPNSNNGNNPIVTQIPKIKFCSQPNLGGTCKTYDLSYKFYPFEAQCGSDEIGFRAESIIIENDDPSKYRISLKGYQGNPGDTHCGPGSTPLNATPNCYNSNIYGISGDRGTCIADSASGVNWTMNNMLGGIDVSKN